MPEFDDEENSLSKGADFAREGAVPAAEALFGLQERLGFLHPGGSTLVVAEDSQATSVLLRARGFEARGVPPGADLLETFSAFPDASFVNLALGGVLARVPAEHLITFVLELGRVIAPGGRVVLSLPHSADGRLAVGKIILLLESARFRCAQRTHGARSTVLLLEETPERSENGLQTIQSILAHDTKRATYKFALIRALAVVSRTEPKAAVWQVDGVYVPLHALAVRWLAFYWPFLTHPHPVAQLHGGQQPEFRAAFETLGATYMTAGLYRLMQDVDSALHTFRAPLTAIARVIKKGPIKHSGRGGVFEFAPTTREGGRGPLDLGWVRVPEPVWMDISRFEHWIEDSIVVRWAQLTAEMNQTEPGPYVSMLLSIPDPERDTAVVRELLGKVGLTLECAWSGRSLRKGYDIDHAIPYSIWRNNDLWNLLPCDSVLNNAKRERLPGAKTLLASRDRIITYWQAYYTHLPGLFVPQAHRALGCAAPATNWENLAFTGLQESVERLAAARGMPRWEAP